MSELKTNLQSILQEKTTKLIPENIKRKVEIFDVTGTDGDAEVEELQAKIIETRQEIADTRRDLENSAATVTGTGENVTLNQTAEATFKKLGVGGNSIQVQLTGKNKLQSTLAIIKDRNTIGTWNNNVYTVSGVTFTVNNDLSITIGGTYTSGDLKLNISPMYYNIWPQEYILNGCPSNSSTGTFELILDVMDGDTYISSSSDTGSGKTFDLSSLTTPKINSYIRIQSSSAIGKTFKPMLRLSSIADDTYEPYVGGQASPNPVYPQEIKNCGDNVNEWDKELEVAAWTDEGVKNTNNHLFAVNSTPKDVKPNTTYTVSQKENPSQYRISFFNNNTFISNIYNAQDTTEGYKSYTFTTPSNCNKVYVHFRSTLEVIAKGTYDMTTEDITNIKLELGTNATSYSPYGCGNVNMKVSNKNLFNKDTILLNKELVGNYGNVISTSGWYVSDFIRVKPNTNYRLTKGANGSSNCFYDINKKFIKTVIGARDVASPNDDRIAYVRFNGVLTDLDINSIQFEEGSTVTEYVSHQEQTFTFPLAEGQKLMLGDYLADDGIHHIRGQVVLDGSKNINWNINSLATHYNFYAQVVSNCKARQLITCSHSSSNSFDDTLNNCYISAAKNFNFNFSIDGVTTSNTFNNWLSTHNTVVEYELQEEVIVPYTEAQQQVYDAMKRAISYEEQTNISSPDEVSPIFTVTAFRDADLAIASLDNQLTLKE